MATDFSVAGYGYTGRRLVPGLRKHGTVTVISRTDCSNDTSDDDDVKAVCADLGTPEAATDSATVVYMAPPPANSDRDLTLESFLQYLGTPSRFVYLSTSGVYGDCDGRLVDEEHPVNPSTARALRRHAAEQALQQWSASNGCELVILRVAGIYGPGRLPLERIRRQEPVLRAGEAGPGNRIHVDDLVQACLRAATLRSVPTIVNVSDGNHMSSSEFTTMVARCAGMKPPPSISLARAREVFTPMRWSFLSESRRLDNRRLREALQVELQFANPLTGVEHALRDT